MTSKVQRNNCSYIVIHDGLEDYALVSNYGNILV